MLEGHGQGLPVRASQIRTLAGTRAALALPCSAPAVRTSAPAIAAAAEIEVVLAALLAFAR